MNQETMLEAFLRQTKIDDKAADDRDKTIKELQDNMLYRSLQKQSAMPKIREAVNIPTKLLSPANKFPDVPKPGQKGYTEINRWKAVGGKTVADDGLLDDGLIEMGDLGAEDVK